MKPCLVLGLLLGHMASRYHPISDIRCPMWPYGYYLLGIWGGIWSSSGMSMGRRGSASAGCGLWVCQVTSVNQTSSVEIIQAVRDVMVKFNIRKRKIITKGKCQSQFSRRPAAIPERRARFAMIWCVRFLGWTHAPLAGSRRKIKCATQKGTHDSRQLRRCASD